MATNMRYYRGLDGLRGIAIALVLFQHWSQLVPNTDAALPQWLQRIQAGSWIGMELFFVTSGFLITANLLNTKSLSSQLKTFWIRRALRILPLAYLYIGILVFISLVTRKPILHHPWMYLFMAGNIDIAFFGWPHLFANKLWSLAVEEQFYVTWPLLVRYSERYLIPIILTLLVLCPFLRWIIFERFGSVAAYVLTFTHIDSIVMGCLIAFIAQNPRPFLKLQVWANRLFPVTLLIIFSSLLGAVNRDTLRSPAMSIASAITVYGATFSIWVVCALHPKPFLKPIILAPAIRYLGRRCYGLYIWHHLAAFVATRLFLRLGLDPRLLLDNLIMGAIAYSATIIFAECSWRFLELPFLNLKPEWSKTDNLARWAPA